MRFLLKGWALSFLGFGLLVLALSAQGVAGDAATWTDAARPVVRDWMPWAVCVPLLFALVDRLPLDRRRWFLAVPAHALCCLGTLAVCDLWANFYDPHFREMRGFQMGHPPRGGRPFPPPPSPPSPPQPPGARGGRPPLGPPVDPVRLAGFYLPIYCAVIGIAHALHFHRRSQERDASLTLARLETLKMQLQPHFLFNTLNMIAELVHSDPDRADKMLTALSDLLRLTLETQNTRVVPLRRELQFIESYLAILHARFDERLQFQMQIAPGTETALVPTLALQPLVENAVEHGLKERAEGGLVTVSSRRDGALLRLIVADNGAGFSKKTPLREGVGLSNTRARLRALYGDAARLDLRDSGGATVEITLPFRAAAV